MLFQRSTSKAARAHWLALAVCLASCSRTGLGDALQGASLPGADSGDETDASADGSVADAALDDARGTRDAQTDGSDSDAGFGPPPDPSSASSFLINPAHTGAVLSPTLRPPLQQIWSVPLGPSGNIEHISYPLIVHGVVYVLVLTTTDTFNLLALDAHTGATIWGPVDTSGSFGLAYDGGRIFVVNSRALLQAFDASTGAHVWSATLPHPYPSFSAAPTAYRGIVYVGGGGDLGGYLYASDEADGTLLWQQPVDYGDDSAPTVGDDGVFVAYSCLQAYAFDRITGAPRWHHSTDCGGGGGETTVLFNGLIYAADVTGNQELDVATGASRGSFNAGVQPAFDGQMGFFVNRGVSAVDLATGAVAWTFPGDSTFDTPAVVAGNTVYVGAVGGMLYALDEPTGQLLWSTNAGGTVPFADGPYPLFDAMAAGEGILVTPAGGSLVAYAPAGPIDIDASADGP